MKNVYTAPELSVVRFDLAADILMESAGGEVFGDGNIKIDDHTSGFGY